jgi:type IV pilus assembly protein PilA
VKEMIKRVREDRGGFTLAELLIVVAIIMVLVAVAIPVFTSAMDSANMAVGRSAGRSIQSEATSAYLTDTTITDKTSEVTFYAKVDKNGNVTDFGKTEIAGATDVTGGLSDDAAKTLGAAIAASADGEAVSVKIKGDKVTG